MSTGMKSPVPHDAGHAPQLPVQVTVRITLDEVREFLRTLEELMLAGDIRPGQLAEGMLEDCVGILSRILAAYYP